MDEPGCARLLDGGVENEVPEFRRVLPSLGGSFMLGGSLLD